MKMWKVWLGKTKQTWKVGSLGEKDIDKGGTRLLGESFGKHSFTAAYTAQPLDYSPLHLTTYHTWWSI
jgi:hypothetical protein